MFELGFKLHFKYHGEEIYYYVKFNPSQLKVYLKYSELNINFTQHCYYYK